MTPSGLPSTIGMIAGNGLYPDIFARAARRAGTANLVAAAFIDETDPVLGDLVDHLEWMRVGQLGKMIKFFKSHTITTSF